MLPTSSPEAPCPARLSHPSPSHTAELAGRTRGVVAHPEGRLPEHVQLPRQGPGLYTPSKTGTALKGQQWSPGSWPHVPWADMHVPSCASERDSPHPALPSTVSKIPSALRSPPPRAGPSGAEVTGLKAASSHGGRVGHCGTQASPTPARLTRIAAWASAASSGHQTCFLLSHGAWPAWFPPPTGGREQGEGSCTWGGICGQGAESSVSGGAQFPVGQHLSDHPTTTTGLSFLRPPGPASPHRVATTPPQGKIP